VFGKKNSSQQLAKLLAKLYQTGPYVLYKNCNRVILFFILGNLGYWNPKFNAGYCFLFSDV